MAAIELHMAKRTYKGSCHCKAITFEADVDFDKGVAKCNCSFCTKIRHWGVMLKPNELRILTGEDSLSDYQHGTKMMHLYFCKHCGVRPFAKGHLDLLGGDFWTLQVATLDDAQDELVKVKTRFSNGRDNDWQNEPAETRHL